MTIEINDKRTIKEIQKEFSSVYPYLKIEFYKKPHNWQEFSKNKDHYDPAEKIGSIRRGGKKGAVIQFHPWQKTGDVEMLFHDELGLQVQICRKQDDHWIQTAGTDELTLAEQNELGKAATESYQHGGDNWVEKEKFL
jgi:hypothetical protein